MQSISLLIFIHTSENQKLPETTLSNDDGTRFLVK